MLHKLLARTKFLQTVELWPPEIPTGRLRSGPGEFGRLCERVEALGEHFDAFHVVDLRIPSRTFLDSVVTAVQLKGRLRRLELAPTLSARDRNKKSLEEAISSALFFGIENLILVRGDPFPPGGRVSRNVYDLKRVSDMVRLVRSMQAKMAVDGLCVLTPIDLTRIGDPKYLQVVRERERSTSDVFLSKTFVGAPEDYLPLLDLLRSEGVRSPVLHNVFPFFSYDDAVTMSERFGLRMPKGALERLKASGLKAGLMMASEFRDALKSNRGKVNGVYISSRGRPELALLLAR